MDRKRVTQQRLVGLIIDCVKNRFKILFLPMSFTVH